MCLHHKNVLHLVIVLACCEILLLPGYLPCTAFFPSSCIYKRRRQRALLVFQPGAQAEHDVASKHFTSGVVRRIDDCQTPDFLGLGSMV